MDYEETMVEQEDAQAAEDDALQEDLAETKDESESLESITEEEDGQPADDEAQEKGSQGTSEPGWIKKRVEKAVERERAKMQAEFDAQRAQMKSDFEAQLAPLRAKMLEDEAKELVRQGEFKSLDRAKEYLQLKQGINSPPETKREPKQEQPRNEQGQFVSAKDAAINAKIEMLSHQADTIKAKTGVDVIDIFNTDPDIKQAVISGKMDFYDVAEQARKTPKKKPPSPMRSPNGASGAEKSTIASMSDEQFSKLEKRISEGVRYNLR